MSEQNNKEEKEAKSAVPIPYSVIGAGWIVLMIGATAFVPPLAWLAFIAGPALMIAKVCADAERFAKMKDNPPAKKYDFHGEGVLDAFEEAVKTLPGYFKDTSVYLVFRNVTVQKGPMKVEYSITLRHPDEDNKNQKPSEAKSTLYIRAFITRLGNNSELKLQFQCEGDRLLLEPVIDHLMAKIDELTAQHKG